MSKLRFMEGKVFRQELELLQQAEVSASVSLKAATAYSSFLLFSLQNALFVLFSSFIDRSDFPETCTRCRDHKIRAENSPSSQYFESQEGKG